MDDFTFRHPWWAAVFLGLAIFGVAFFGAAMITDIGTAGTGGALIAVLLATTVGIVWRGGIAD